MRRLARAFLPCLLAACAADAPAPADPRTTVTVLQAGSDEWLAGPYTDDGGKKYFFEPLTRWVDGDPAPALAKRWERSDDYRRWTVHLRDDVRWHDGVPFTAHDVAFTIDLWRHPDVQHYAGGGWGQVRVVDDTTITFTYDEPSVYHFGGWDVFYPKHLLEGLDPKGFDDWEFWTRPIGNGPWRYVRHIPKTTMELEANPDYYLGRPKIDRLLLKFGSTSALTELFAGNVDVAVIQPADARRVEADGRFRVIHNFIGARYQVFWNHADPRFADARVRRALAMAADRRELHRLLDLPPDVPLYDGICTNRQIDRNDCGAAHPYDPEAAARLLEEAGWRDSDGDGVRERDGTELRFDLLAPQGIYTQAAIVLADQLRRMGVRAEVTTADQSVVRGRIEEKRYQAAVIHYANGRGHHHEQFVSRNFANWQHPRAAFLLDSAQTVIDPAAYDEAYREISRIFFEEQPVLLLWNRTVFRAVHKRIKGLEEGGGLAAAWVEEG